MKIYVTDIEWEEGLEQDWNEIDIELDRTLVNRFLKVDDVRELVENFINEPGLESYELSYDWGSVLDIVASTGVTTLLDEGEFEQAAEIMAEWARELGLTRAYHCGIDTEAHETMSTLVYIFGRRQVRDLRQLDELVSALDTLAEELTGGHVYTHMTSQTGDEADWDDIDLRDEGLTVEKIAAFEIVCDHTDLHVCQRDIDVSYDIDRVLTEQDIWKGTWMESAQLDMDRQHYDRDCGTEMHTYYREDPREA